MDSIRADLQAALDRFEERWGFHYDIDAVEQHVLFQKDVKKKIATITMNRPEVLNAQTNGMFERMKILVEHANYDEDIKVLVFKGAGRAFSSGMDVDELGVRHGTKDASQYKARRPSQRQRLLADMFLHSASGVYGVILGCKKCTIAAVQGICYGGGLNLSNVCDITIAADNAKFTHPGYLYIGPTMDLWLLTQLVGIKKAREMTLTAIPVDAQEALRIGLVNKVVPLAKLDEEVNAMAQAAARLPADGIVMGKCHHEGVLDIMGKGTGYSLSYIMHAMQTGIRYEPDEFNFFKEKSEKGISAAIQARVKKTGH